MRPAWTSTYGATYAKGREVANADLLAAVLFCSIVFQVEFQPCGQVAGAIREIEPAHVVFNRMLLGARDQLDRMNRCRL